jgi:hypothetical protein
MKTTTLHEARCTFCNARAWTRLKPNPAALLRRVPRCRCGKPMLDATGATRQVPARRRVDVRRLL